MGYLADGHYRLAVAIAPLSDGGFEVLRRDGEGAYQQWLTVSLEDSFNTTPVAIDTEGTTLYLADSRGRNTSALTAIDLRTGFETMLVHDPRADLEDLLRHPLTGRVRAAYVNYDRRVTHVLEAEVEEDFDFLSEGTDGVVQVVSMSHDDRRWIVSTMMDDGPLRFYLYERTPRRATLLFTSRPALERYPLAKMHARILRSRDGLDLVAYLSLPPGTDPQGAGVPAQPLPMILQVHGGPWHRDSWGFNPYHQWATNRGYAMLMIQFRGSTGFGKSFVNAGDHEWGGKMHDDLLDAVEWAVETGVAQRDKIAIMGGSYGGYACLWGMTNTPEVFACGIDIFGVSNLITMLETFPAYWGTAMETMYRRIGDPRTEEGRAFLTSRSPLTYVENIRRPLLIVHGANDVRVTLGESEQIVSAMKERGIPVTYVVYPDEGHLTFFHPQNNISFFAIAEQFLAQHLGGGAEPIDGAFQGASLQIREGAGEVPGVKEAFADGER
jgi:dipeptidyl aminopeptidase/acylaminoacyl peptidase